MNEISYITELAHNVIDAQKEYFDSKTQTDILEKEFKAAKMKLYEQLTIEKMPSIRLENKLLVRSYKPFMKVVDDEVAQDYFKKVGLFNSFYQYEPRKGRINEYLKENFLDKNVPIPEGEMGIIATVTPSISIRNAGGGGDEE